MVIFWFSSSDLETWLDQIIRGIVKDSVLRDMTAQC